MSFSVNPGTFQSMNIETRREKHFFLSQLSTLLTQITNQITNQTKYTSAAILPIDLSQPAQATVPAWTLYNALFTSGTGTITAQTSAMSYLQIGKLVFVNGVTTVTNIGTAAGAMFFNLPAGLLVKRGFSFGFRENGISGSIFEGFAAGGAAAVRIMTSANVNPTWANNFQVMTTFSYEAS